MRGRKTRMFIDVDEGTVCWLASLLCTLNWLHTRRLLQIIRSYWNGIQLTVDEFIFSMYHVILLAKRLTNYKCQLQATPKLL